MVLIFFFVEGEGGGHSVSHIYPLSAVALES